MADERVRSAAGLEAYLRARVERKQLLLMTHWVIGYPSLEESFRVVEAMVSAGVDLIELQIPFSEPIADGPVILAANQAALAKGTDLEACFTFAKQVAARFSVPFLFMSYYNLLFTGGVARFVERASDAGIAGIIVPDLPPEEAGEYLASIERAGLAPIFIFAPTTSDTRMALIARRAKGFVYAVARKGVTGSRTELSSDLEAYLARARRATALPLAVGFGIAGPEDVAFLRGKADIAVVGSQTIRVAERGGAEAVGTFVRELVEAASRSGTGPA